MNKITAHTIKPPIIGAYILNTMESPYRYLLMKRSGTYFNGFWQTIWGKVHDGETCPETALREIKEETGLIPDRFYNSDALEMFYEPPDDQIYLAPIFVAYIDKPQEITLHENEHDAYRWVTYEEALEELPFNCQQQVVRHIQKNFVEKAPNPIFQIKK